ncbi:E3 ubiquitin-protein ligase RNF180-like [Brevipalpus obovatus]|uniref:E3 ubiquitin-protein ligase RNF180-like n=1 Tax=Brevipalpus obovatus TaxID=246614 RepID=UPI003D9E8A7C
MIKCKKCRKDLIHVDNIVTGHGQHVFNSNGDDGCDSQVWYVKDEDLMDDCVLWIRAQIDSEEWIKGKLICPHETCGARLGSFNFITRLKCKCRRQLVPPVHLIKKRVDIPYSIPLGSDVNLDQSHENDDELSGVDSDEEEEVGEEELMENEGI